MSDYQSIEEYQNRLSKLEEIKRYLVEPYPHKFEPTHSCAALLDECSTEKGNSEDAETGTTDSVNMAGRIVLFRAMGKTLLLKSKMNQAASNSCLTVTILW